MIHLKWLPLFGYFLNEQKRENLWKYLVMPLFVTATGIIYDSPLTTRETDVLHLLAKGLQQKQIAKQLSISSETVKKHLKNCYKKLNVHNKVQALRMAGLIWKILGYWLEAESCQSYIQYHYPTISPYSSFHSHFQRRWLHKYVSGYWEIKRSR